MLARWVGEAISAADVASNDGPYPMFSPKAVQPGAAGPRTAARLLVWYSAFRLAISCEWRAAMPSRAPLSANGGGPAGGPPPVPPPAPPAAGGGGRGRAST